MPSTRVAFPEVQSWTPAVEAKAVENGSLFVLNGRNYYFDSKGPKSGFGSSVLPGGAISAGGFVTESISFADRTILFTETKALDRRWTGLEPVTLEGEAYEYWNTVAEFESLYARDVKNQKWTSAYVGYAYYVCHPQRGTFKVLSDSLEPHTGPGIPEDPIAIVETNGRLVVLTRFTLAYSAPFDGDDFTPTLGGAGFQVTAELVPGNPITLTTFEGGFLLWTDGGVLIGEYVGGESVFRFDRVNTDQLLIGGAAWSNMQDGSIVIMTKQGLMRSTAQAGFQELTPIFNEYLREFIRESEDIVFRLSYIQEMDHLYVQIMDGTNHFNHTYVLSVKLDKWGIFSTDHHGIVRFSNEIDDYGWIDLEGFPHLFDASGVVESVDGQQAGLDSEIILGYIRPSQVQTADGNFEIQEVLTSNGPRLTDTAVIEEDWNGDESFINWNTGFVNVNDDYNAYGLNDYKDDYNFMEGVEDYNLMLFSDSVDMNMDVIGPVSIDFNDWGPAEDYNDTPEGSYDVIPLEDWNLKLNGDEDWYKEQSFLNAYEYGLRLTSNLDGYESELEVTPVLATRRIDMDMWTCFTHGHNHRLTFSATQSGEKYHMRSLEITLHYAGQQG